MKLTEIYIYPIKSCQGIKLDKAEVTPKGFLNDREFMVVDETGKFLTQRQHPNLAKIKVNLADNLISLATSDNRINPLHFEPTLIGGTREVEIWRDRTIGIDQGDEVAAWFETVLNFKKCRLVKQSSEFIRPIDKNYAKRDNQPVSFADGYPFLLTTIGSLKELNRRLREVYQEDSQEVQMNRFRPNIVVDTSEPFREGNWKLIEIGKVKFSLVKPCSRCLITTTDQNTGERNKLQEPLKTLSTFRKWENQGIMFGENMIPRNTGLVTVGDEVKILEGL